MKNTHLQELKNSGITDGIIDLNFKSLEGPVVYEYLAYGCDKRLNAGRLPTSWIERYKNCEEGGWWCNGIDTKTGEDLQWGCFKPDFPKMDINKGKPIKYEHPKGVSTDVFVLKINEETAKKLSERYGVEFVAGNFWEQVFANTYLPIIITEGAKKAAALLSAGWIAIGLPGIFAGYRRESKATHGLLPSLTALAGHPVYFAFDQDAKSETRQAVKTAIAKTAKAFSEFGCKCKTVNWSEDYKGVDDLLIADPEAFEQAMRAAVEVDTSNEQQIRDEINLLVDQGKSGSKLSTALMGIGKSHHQPINVIRAIHKEICDEREREESRAETISELELIEKANGAKLDLWEVLPEQIARPIQQQAEMMGLRPEGHLTAMLVGLSSLGSPETELTLHHDWGFTVTPGLYGGLVAQSSQRKSVVIKSMITKPLGKIQREEKERFEAELAEWKIQSDRYAALKSSKKPDELQDEFPEGEPKKPTRALRYCTDMNGEGLKRQLVETPNQGILGLADELVSLFKSANQYRGGKGSDVEDMLSLYDGTGVSILRKSEVTDVERALFSIFGSTQPDVLKQWIDDGRDANGQWGRFIFVYQPQSPAYITEDTRTINIDPMIEWIYREKAKLPAQKYVLTPAAFESFRVVHNYYEGERVNKGDQGGVTNVLGKNSGRVGKLSIVLHELKYICLGQTPPREVDVDVIRAAIKLTAFYTLQTRYLYSRFSDNPTEIAPHLFKIIDLSTRLGEITPRIVKKYNVSKDVDSIICWFRELAALGRGTITEGRTVKFTATGPAPEQNCQDAPTIQTPYCVTDTAEVAEVAEVSETQLETQPAPKVGDHRYSPEHLCEGEIMVIEEGKYTIHFDNGLGLVYPSLESLIKFSLPVNTANQSPPAPSAPIVETVATEDDEDCLDYPAEDSKGQTIFVGADVKIVKDGTTGVVTEIKNNLVTLATESGIRKMQASLLESLSVIDQSPEHTDK